MFVKFGPFCRCQSWEILKVNDYIGNKPTLGANFEMILFSLLCILFNSREQSFYTIIFESGLFQYSIIHQFHRLVYKKNNKQYSLDTNFIIERGVNFKYLLIS